MTTTDTDAAKCPHCGLRGHDDELRRLHAAYAHVGPRCPSGDGVGHWSPREVHTAVGDFVAGARAEATAHQESGRLWEALKTEQGAWKIAAEYLADFRKTGSQMSLDAILEMVDGGNPSLDALLTEAPSSEPTDDMTAQRIAYLDRDDEQKVCKHCKGPLPGPCGGCPHEERGWHPDD